MEKPAQLGTIVTNYPGRCLGVGRSLRFADSFRTNLILANATEFESVVDVSLLSDTGTTLGSKSYSLPPLGMTQITRIVRDMGVTSNISLATLRLSTATSNGAFCAYAVVIDNVTGDPRTLLPR